MFQTNHEQFNFKNQEEELAYLRNKVQEQHSVISKEEAPAVAPEIIKQQQEEIATQVVQEYKEIPITQALAPAYQINQTRTESIALSLSPETHDEQISSLCNIMMTHGIRNALSVIAQMNNPHLDDDFHRFLVAYILSYKVFPKNEIIPELLSPITTTLYEIVMPKYDNRGKDEKDPNGPMSIMEQFISGMQSLTYPIDGKSFTYTLEIAMSFNSPVLSFFASIPNERRSIFEKQLTALYPDAHLSVAKDDYNIFNPEGVALGAYADSTEHEYYPLKTYTEFERDPLYVITNVFSKLKAKGEGASIQFIIGF